MTQVDLHIFGAFVTMLCAGFLIACPKYQDGVVGRFGLGILCFSAGMILIRWFEGFPFVPSASEMATNLGIVIFLGWHCFRFGRRILKEQSLKRRATDKVTQ